MNSSGTAESTIVTTTHTTRYRRFVRGLPGKCRAHVKSGNIFLSNNRTRQIYITQTVLGGTPVLMLSRTATFTSPRGRCGVRRTLGSLVGSGAIVVVTRHLSSVMSSSQVVMLGSKETMRYKQRRRLSSRRKMCGGV